MDQKGMASTGNRYFLESYAISGRLVFALQHQLAVTAQYALLPQQTLNSDLDVTKHPGR
jgi:hypothetical protein